MQVLIDTSIWIDHLRSGNLGLKRLIQERNALSHPFIVGELAMGGLKDREEFLRFLQRLPTAVTAKDFEVLKFVDEYRLHGLGIGYVDVHLLVSARLTPEARFWTRDERLMEIAARFRLAYGADFRGTSHSIARRQVPFRK